ncbi:MAG: FG-GAP repeat protein, partial [Chloroflexi bacterium]|nr:FG-GAP repeat protein [Chloroflexota bacterium]
GLADIVAVSRTDSGPDGRRTNAGAAYVVFGSRSLSGTLDLASGAANATVYGVEPSSLLATSVDTRDLDGNGRDDIVLGTALAGGNGRSLSGVTYVVFDQDLPGTVDLREAPANSLFVYGAAQGDGLGTGVAIGDINGDGRPELILAAAGPTQGQQRPARIYAIDLP